MLFLYNTGHVMSKISSQCSGPMTGIQAARVSHVTLTSAANLQDEATVKRGASGEKSGVDMGLEDVDDKRFSKHYSKVCVFDEQGQR